MTIIENREMTCAVCGHTSHGSVLLSTYSMGGGDLDFCPPPLARNMFGTEITVCPNCHYVASDISREVSAETKNFVLTDPAFQEEYSSYSVTAYKNIMRIALFEERYHDAFTACLKAAWFNEKRGNIRDEFGSCNPAIRIEALEIFDKYENELKFDADTKLCLKADLLRRTMRFAEAVEFARSSYTTNWDVRCILAYQAYLAEKGDYARHTIYSAQKWGGENFYGKKTPADSGSSGSQKTRPQGSGISDGTSSEARDVYDDSEILPDNSGTPVSPDMGKRPPLWSRIFGKRSSRK